METNRTLCCRSRVVYPHLRLHECLVCVLLLRLGSVGWAHKACQPVGALVTVTTRSSGSRGRSVRLLSWQEIPEATFGGVDRRLTRTQEFILFVYWSTFEKRSTHSSLALNVQRHIATVTQLQNKPSLVGSVCVLLRPEQPGHTDLSALSCTPLQSQSITPWLPLTTVCSQSSAERQLTHQRGTRI